MGRQAKMLCWHYFSFPKVPLNLSQSDLKRRLFSNTTLLKATFTKNGTILVSLSQNDLKIVPDSQNDPKSSTLHVQLDLHKIAGWTMVKNKIFI
jgi:hypothetical protein